MYVKKEKSINWGKESMKSGGIEIKETRVWFNFPKNVRLGNKTMKNIRVKVFKKMIVII